MNIIGSAEVCDATRRDSFQAQHGAVAADPAIALVTKSVLMPRPMGRPSARGTVQPLIPDHLDADSDQDMERVRHQLAVRGHAAWNVRSAISDANRPWAVVVDWFGAGTPADGHASQFTGGDFATGGGDDHGYHVLGIITSEFEPGAGGSARYSSRTPTPG